MDKFARATAPKWSEAEDNILREYYPKMKKGVTALLPGRTEAACAIRAGHLNVYIYGRPWSKEEDAVLREKYPQIGEKVIEFLPDRSRAACRKRAAELEIPHVRGAWTKQEDDILCKYYPIMGIAIRDRLPYRSRQSIYCRAIRLGLSREEDIEEKKRAKAQTAENHASKPPRKPWSAEEEEILRAKYPLMGAKVQEYLPERSVSSIYRRAVRLNLVRVTR